MSMWTLERHSPRSFVFPCQFQPLNVTCSMLRFACILIWFPTESITTWSKRWQELGYPDVSISSYPQAELRYSADSCIKASRFFPVGHFYGPGPVLSGASVTMKDDVSPEYLLGHLRLPFVRPTRVEFRPKDYSIRSHLQNGAPVFRICLLWCPGCMTWATSWSEDGLSNLSIYVISSLGDLSMISSWYITVGLPETSRKRSNIPFSCVHYGLEQRAL